MSDHRREEYHRLNRMLDAEAEASRERVVRADPLGQVIISAESLAEMVVWVAQGDIPNRDRLYWYAGHRGLSLRGVADLLRRVNTHVGPHLPEDRPRALVAAGRLLRECGLVGEGAT